MLRQDDGFAGRGDDAFALLIRGHEGLSDAESAALNARLVLILAHEVGDLAVLDAAVALARRSLRPEPLAPGESP
ncbi:MAG: DUF2783 domain-containing protein [Methylobacterium frigidaeris]